MAPVKEEIVGKAPLHGIENRDPIKITGFRGDRIVTDLGALGEIKNP
jgi:hypothetical protein